MTDTLVVYAVAREAQGCRLDGRGLELGVGKVSAACRLTAALHVQRPDRVLAVGVCGAYRAAGDGVRLAVGDLCVVASDRLADEGVQTEEGFLDLADLELGDATPIAADAEWTDVIAGRLAAPIVHGATVSTCSGTDRRAADLLVRTGAQVETMEGAAIGWVCRNAGIPWAQLRVVSNFTGDRKSAQWNLDLAVSRLGDAVNRLLASGPVDETTAGGRRQRPGR